MTMFGLRGVFEDEGDSELSLRGSGAGVLFADDMLRAVIFMSVIADDRPTVAFVCASVLMRFIVSYAFFQV